MRPSSLSMKLYIFSLKCVTHHNGVLPSAPGLGVRKIKATIKVKAPATSSPRGHDDGIEVSR